MKLFHKKKEPLPIPAPFTAADIRIETGICTGERTIGFYDRKTHRLRYAVPAHSEQDIRDFYTQYGAVPDETEMRR